MRLTDLLAIYGASLSTATAVWNYFRAQPQVRVLLVFALETIEGESQHGVHISIQNPSDKTVHITNVSLLYPLESPSFLDRLKHLAQFKRISRSQEWCHSSFSNFGIEDKCPVSIEAGKSHGIFVRNEALDKLLEGTQSRRVKVVVQDALWRNRYSKAFNYSTQEKQGTKTDTTN